MDILTRYIEETGIRILSVFHKYGYSGCDTLGILDLQIEAEGWPRRNRKSMNLALAELLKDGLIECINNGLGWRLTGKGEQRINQLASDFEENSNGEEVDLDDDDEQTICPRCKGSGKLHNGEPEECTVCWGKGYVD
jgi:hypothetical protein